MNEYTRYQQTWTCDFFTSSDTYSKYFRRFSNQSIWVTYSICIFSNTVSQKTSTALLALVRVCVCVCVCSMCVCPKFRGSESGDGRGLAISGLHGYAQSLPAYALIVSQIHECFLLNSSKQ